MYQEQKGEQGETQLYVTDCIRLHSW